MRKAKISLAIIAVLILGGFTYLLVNSGISAKNLQMKTIKLESTEAKLKDVNLQVDELKNQSTKDKENQQQLQKQLEQKEQEKKDLEAKLQAKLDAKAKLEVAAAKAEQQLTGAQPAAAAPRVSGSKVDWMVAAGISESDYTYVDYIITKESGWNPYAVNRSSGAEGLPQALPYSKTNCERGDPICQLRWANGYAVGRYGSWAGAYNFWLSKHWW